MNLRPMNVSFFRLFVYILFCLGISCKRTNNLPLSVAINTRFSISSVCTELFMTSRHDQQGKDYLYVAAKEGGLKIYSLAGNPKLVKTIPTTELSSLEVM